jgi:hypothetical protein
MPKALRENSIITKEKKIEVKNNIKTSVIVNGKNKRMMILQAWTILI